MRTTSVLPRNSLVHLTYCPAGSGAVLAGWSRLIFVSWAAISQRSQRAALILCVAALAVVPALSSAQSPTESHAAANSYSLPSAPEPQVTPGKAPTQRKKKYSPSATAGSPGHIFWVVPAFKVNYAGGFKPLTPKEKFQEWAHGAYDPLGLAAGAVEAGTLEYSSSDGFCGYGMGLANYGKCFGSLELDANVSSFIGDYALTVAFHQDPRYFRLGKGSFGRRTWYAITRVFVTFNDSGKNVFYTSALTGTVAAAAISNLYYPPQDKGLGHTLSRIYIDLGNTAIYNGAAEFWPDIHHGLRRVF
jgi:hypothetical protein